MSLPLPEHLPLIAAAPDGIRKLRALILDLAMRGKLVPQNAADEPASSLLKRIERERAQLIEVGAIKKSKASPTLAENDQPFALPNGWQWVRLAAIGNIFNGNSINSNEKDIKYRRDDGLPYIATKDVGYGLTPLDYENGVRIPESEQNFKMARAGSVFICAEGGSAGKKCGLSDRDVFFGNKLFAYEAFAGIPPRLVLYLYLSPFFRKQFSAVMTGIIGGVSIAKFTELLIPLPPLTEQHRIVAKVDELMALCDRLESEQNDSGAAHTQLVETLLDSLTQSTDAADFEANWKRIAEHFDTLFTTEDSIDALQKTILQLAVMGKLMPQDPEDESAAELLNQIQSRGTLRKPKGLPAEDDIECPFALPNGWAAARFWQVAVVNGRLVDSKEYSDAIQVAPDVIEKGTGRLLGKRTVHEAGVRGPNQQFKAGQLLYSKIRPSLSKAVIVDFDGLCSADMYPLDPQIEPRFLLIQILSEVFLEQVRIAENRVKMPKLNQESLNLFFVCIPPLAEQHRIVAKVDELMAVCNKLKASIQATTAAQSTLSAALIQQALEAA